MNNMYKQWEIYMANLNPTKWNEQAGERPVVIVSGDSFNSNGNLVMVCPLTTQIKNYYGDPIIEPNKTNWLEKNSEILVFQIRSLSTQRFLKKKWYIITSEISDLIKGLNQLLMC
jgi:mRNA interferase MazF